MNPEDFKKLLKEFQQPLKEAEIVPTGPDGQKITDPVVIKNLNLALKAVSPTIRPKIIQMIQDPDAAKELRNPAQKAAVLGAMAIAFGISEKEFTQIVGKIKAVLPDAKSTEPTEPQP